MSHSQRHHSAAGMDRRGVVFVLSGAFCISFAAFFVKGAPIDSSMVAFYRLFFGAIALFIAALIQKAPLRIPRQCVGIIVLAGALFSGDLIVWHKSILYVGPGIATIIANFEVILLAVFGVVVLKERLSLPQKLSAPLALVGLAFLLGIHTQALPPGTVTGVLLALLSACFYAAYVLTLRRTQSIGLRMAPVANMAWVSLFCCIFTGLFCLGNGVSFGIPDIRTGVILAVLGIVCQSLGWVLLSIGLPHLTPFRAGLLMLTQPALSYLWDSLFYGTATEPLNIFGAILAIAAIGMGIYSPAGKDHRPTPETTASGRYPPPSSQDKVTHIREKEE